MPPFLVLLYYCYNKKCDITKLRKRKIFNIVNKAKYYTEDF